MIQQLKDRVMLRSIKHRLQSFYKNNLPEQRHFSIEELLLRWEADGVTFKQLCDWVERENFVMGVRVRDTSSLSEQFESKDGAVVTGTSRSTVLAGSAKPPIQTDFLSTDTLVKILTAAPGRKVGAPVTYSAISREKASGTLHLSGGRFYSKEDLVACWEEV